MANNTSKLSLSQLGQGDVFWATGFGLGFLRPAPGTWGSLGAVLLWLLWPASASLSVQVTLTLAYTGFSIWMVARLMQRLGVQDEPQIVADEIAGMWAALCFVEAEALQIAVAFGLFRLLDIAKPWPIGWLDRRYKNSFGVMADDVLAGLVAGAVTMLCLRLIG